MNAQPALNPTIVSLDQLNLLEGAAGDWAKKVELTEAVARDVFSLDELKAEVRGAIDAIAHALMGFYRIQGKDSTVVAVLALEAAREMHAAGEAVPPVMIASSDTHVENPAIVRFVEVMKANTETYMADMDFRFEIAAATPYEDYLVKIFSGRALPATVFFGGNCTDWMKSTPLRRVRKAFAARCRAGGHLAPVILTGSRWDESSRRKGNMVKRQESHERISVRLSDGTFKSLINDGEYQTAVVHNDYALDYTLTPIAHWSTASVFRFLDEVGKGTFRAYQPDFKELDAYYGDSASLCKVIDDPTTLARKQSGCSARSGCYVCLKTGEKDASGEALASNPMQYPYYGPLTKFRDYLGVAACDPDKRNYMHRTLNTDKGGINIGPNTFHPEEADRLLRMALTLQEQEKERAASYAQNKRAAWEKMQAFRRERGLSTDAAFVLPFPHLAQPQFEMINFEQLMMITLCAARENYGPALWPIRAWMDVVENGERFDVPRVDTAQMRPLKAVKYRFLALDQARFEGVLHGLNDPQAVMSDFDGNGEVVNDSDEIIALSSAESLAWWRELELPQLLADESLTNHQLTRRLLRFGVIEMNGAARKATDLKLRQANALMGAGVTHLWLNRAQAEAMDLPLASDVPSGRWVPAPLAARSAEEAFAEALRDLVALAAQGHATGAQQARVTRASRRADPLVVAQAREALKTRLAHMVRVQAQGGDLVREAITVFHDARLMFVAERVDWAGLLHHDALDLIPAEDQLELFA